MIKGFLHLPILGVWKRRLSLLEKVTLALVFKGDLKVEEEEEQGEVAFIVKEDSKEFLEGILQEVKKKTSNVTNVTSMDTIRENVD